MSRTRTSIRALVRGITLSAAVLLIVAAIAITTGLLMGHRPVVITTGSMEPAASPGALVVARPVDDVLVGDMLVMRREGRATVTHRVVEIEPGVDGQFFAVTRGDANPEIDAAPYVLGGEELVGRWVIPWLGRVLLALGSPLVGIAVVTGAVMTVTGGLLRRIWKREGAVAAGARVPRSGQLQSAVGATALGVLLTGGGVAWSLYLGVDTVSGNAFTASDCYDARLGSVQSGQLVSSSNGSAAVTVTAVDPSTSFLVFSVRSASGDPDESQVMGQLTDATTIEFVRQSDAPIAPSIAIEWSVVEYACGVSVQRGVLNGDGSAQIDVPITPVDPAATFVLGSSVPTAGRTAHGLDDLQIHELIGADTVRIRGGGGSFAPSRQLAWQAVTFTAPGDATTQTVSTTLGPGVGNTTVALAAPVDLNTTFVLATVSSAATGPEIGERMVRARLVDPTTIEIVRLATSESVDVHVQVVELREGSTVRHGVVDFAAAESSRDVTIPAVDPSRSTAFATVQTPGSASGGASAHTADDIVGEGSATMSLTDPVTVSVNRTSSVSAASFAWQVVTWGGPSWADPLSPFRQRIDVTAAGVDAPAGYTTSLTFDHASLVTSGLALANGNDARVWRHDGTSWIEIDRVLGDGSSWNAGDTTVWFRTQESIAASTTVSYWLYFGNQTPPPVLADPANVWLLLEGFDSGTLGTFDDRTAGSGWYRALPWTRQMVLTVSAASVGSDLTDHPLLVQLTDGDLAVSAQPDGSDIRFTAADGVTPLPHEIEAWDPTTGALTAWVRMPSISSATDTVLHLYYGAPDAPTQAEPREVWAGETAVWNLARDPLGPAPTLDDSSPGQHDGLALADSSLVVEASGPAVALDGITDRLEAAPFDLPDGALTVAAWVRADVLGVDPVLVAQGDPTAGGVFELAIDTTTVPGTPMGRIRLRAGGNLVEVAGGSVTPGAWHHLAATWDEAIVTLYVDGAAVGTAPAAGSTPNGSSMPVVLGGDPAGARTVQGAIGQVRLSPTAWTLEEIEFVEVNLRSAPTLVTTASPTAGTWFDQGDWTVRRPLAVDATQVGGPLADYPLLVQFTDLALAAEARGDGVDLVFVGADGVTRLDYELEAWDAVTGALTAWVRLPALDDTVDTELFLYSGNGSAADQSDPTGVWGPDADLVLTGSND